MTVSNIIKNYPISSQEFETLQEKYGNLIFYISHQLIKKNPNCLAGLEWLDVAQDLWIVALKICSYYKRQAYIEECFRQLNEINIFNNMNSVCNNSLCSFMPFDYNQKINNNNKWLSYHNTNEEGFVIDNNDIKRLQEKWKNRTKHGAHKQMFGEPEEGELESLSKKFLSNPPQKDEPLTISTRFECYFKSGLWNLSKRIGARITKEKKFGFVPFEVGFGI